MKKNSRSARAEKRAGAKVTMGNWIFQFQNWQTTHEKSSRFPTMPRKMLGKRCSVEIEANVPRFLLLAKGCMLALAGRFQVGDQIQDLLGRQNVRRIRGAWGGRLWRLGRRCVSFPL